MSKAKKYIDSLFNETSNIVTKKQYVIMGQLGVNPPVKLDSADDEPSADYLVKRYQTTLNSEWKVWKVINKQQ